MWESRRDFQRVWEGWEAGFMAFHAFHTLSFPWAAFARQMLDKPICRHPVQCAALGTHSLSLSALAIYHSRSTQFLNQITSENCICRAECTVIAGFWEEARSCERSPCKTSV